MVLKIFTMEIKNFIFASDLKLLESSKVISDINKLAFESYINQGFSAFNN